MTSSGPADTRSSLEVLRSAAIERERSLLESFDGIIEAASDVATDDEHDPEGHTIAWERQQLAGLLDEARAALAEIDAARRRLDDGSYGRCTSCGHDISPQRLDALPATPVCVGCAR